MTSITYVGLDVHTTNYTAACYRFETDNTFAVAELKPKADEIEKYLKRVKKNLGEDCEFLCGYEAGCLGYSLYHELTAKGIKCVIMAPSTIESAPVNKIKTDKRDAKNSPDVLLQAVIKRFMFRLMKIMQSKSIFECVTMLTEH